MSVTLLRQDLLLLRSSSSKSCLSQLLSRAFYHSPLHCPVANYSGDSQPSRIMFKSLINTLLCLSPNVSLLMDVFTGLTSPTPPQNECMLLLKKNPSRFNETPSKLNNPSPKKICSGYIHLRPCI